MVNLPRIIAEAPHDSLCLAEPKTFKKRYTIVVCADEVPAGEAIRCWMPFPRRDNPRQRNVQLAATSEKEYLLAGSSQAHY